MLPSLDRMLAGETDLDALELADLVVHLSPGCALWRATGGPMAWTDETHALVGALHRLEILAWQQTKDGHEGRNRPEPMPHPPFAHEVKAEEQRIADKAAAWHRRNT